MAKAIPHKKYKHCHFLQCTNAVISIMEATIRTFRCCLFSFTRLLRSRHLGQVYTNNVLLLEVNLIRTTFGKILIFFYCCIYFIINFRPKNIKPFLKISKRSRCRVIGHVTRWRYIVRCFVTLTARAIPTLSIPAVIGIYHASTLSHLLVQISSKQLNYSFIIVL